MTDPEFLQILQQGVEGDECVAGAEHRRPGASQILQQGSRRGMRGGSRTRISSRTSAGADLRGANLRGLTSGDQPQGG